MLKNSTNPFLTCLQCYLRHVSVCVWPSSGKSFTYEILLALNLYRSRVNNGTLHKVLWFRTLHLQ